MGTRKPAARIGSLGGPVSGSDLAAFAREVRQSPILDGRELTVTFDGGTSIEVRHGLDRAYRNVLIGEQENPAKVVSVARSSDPTKFVKLVSDSATSMSVKVWVY